MMTTPTRATTLTRATMLTTKSVQGGGGRARRGCVGGITARRYRTEPARTTGDVVRRRSSSGGAGDDEGAPDAASTSSAEGRDEKTVKLDPFGFGARRQDAPDEIIPGFDTAEGGKVGPVGTAAISLLLIGLFGGSFFFTSVPRESVMELAARDLANDPDAPTQTFARR